LGDGNRILWLHVIHMGIVFCSVTASYVFGACIGFDNLENYSIMYGNGSHSLLAYIYVILLIVFLFTLVVFSPFHTIPYAITYWVSKRNWRNPSGTIGRGIFLTFITIVLVLTYPFLIFPRITATRNVIDASSWQVWLPVGLFIIISIYVLPYLFLHLNYPRFRELIAYGVYKKAIKLQAVVYALIIVYWLTPLPAALKQFIDNHYLYYWAK